MATALIQVSMRLRGDALAQALRKAAATTSKTQDFAANRACNAISYKAYLAMPRVSPASIPQELEVSVQGVTKTGRLSRAKKPRRHHVGSHPSSLASRIILASFYAGSRFNETTGQVWKREKPDTHGTAAFWEWIAGAAERMTMARRSSTGFFAACARAVNVGFGMATGRFFSKIPAPVIPSGAMDVNKTSTLLSKGLAHVEPATGGSGLARFSVAATEPDTKGENHALERIAGRVWQNAVDQETAAISQHTAEFYKEALARGGLKVR